MLLCDIGNSSYHFLDEKRDYKKDVENFNPSDIKEKIFYICVNLKVKLLLQTLDNWVDLASYVDMTHYYETMGIDRIVACESICNGVIVDAGSAITIDLVKNRVFSGGFIYPGVNAMSKTYKNISSSLDYSFNFELDLGKMPKNSRDAISYGYLRTLYNEVISHDMQIFLTGGDAEKFSAIFPQAKVEKLLLFNGMKKIIKKADLC